MTRNHATAISLLIALALGFGVGLWATSDPMRRVTKIVYQTVYQPVFIPLPHTAKVKRIENQLAAAIPASLLQRKKP